MYRNNKLIKTIDLYDYITQGNIDQDIRLANNDILFVGPRLSSVTLSGTVKKSAIYELRPNESLQDLFQYSGGLPVGASLNNVNVSRIKPFKDREQELVFDRFLTTINFSDYKNNKKQNFILTDGDVVNVKTILGKQKNNVTISGNVYAPGTFALNVYKDLKTLILDGAKGLKPNTYLDKIDINKEDENGILSYKTFNLQSILNGEIKVLLDENDQVKIYSLAEVEGSKTVSISGYGVRAKTVTIRENLSLFDLIFQSVTFDELEFQSKVLTSRLDLNRFDEKTGLYNLTQYSLDRLEDLKATYLMPKDKVVLYTKSVTQDITPTYTVLGKVSNPGEFSLGNTIYVEDAILIAGGFLDVAEQTFVKINRLDRDLEKGTYSKLKKYQVDIDYMLGNKDKPSNPFILENKDIITVTSPIRALGQPSVSIQGEVNYPQSIIIESDRVTLGKMIDLAGGLAINASLSSSYIIRGGSKLYLDLNKKLDYNTTTLIDNDIIVIGSTLETIKTSGALLNPANFIWNEGKRARYYIRKSGGTKKRIESMQVRQANGKTEKIGLFKNPTIYPGSQIIVTEKPVKTKDGNVNKFFDDFIRIFSVVTGAFTTLILAKNL